jgi:hypothetical protein
MLREAFVLTFDDSRLTGATGKDLSGDRAARDKLFKVQGERFARPELRRIFRPWNKILHFVQDKL